MDKIHDIDEYYLELAKATSRRTKCLKRMYGAVVVVDDRVVTTGFNGPPMGYKHCDECHRMDKEAGGSAYDMNCPAVHAEENALLLACRHGTSVEGGTMYVWGDNPHPPCEKCARAMINAGIKRVITKKEEFSLDDIYDLARSKE